MCGLDCDVELDKSLELEEEPESEQIENAVRVLLHGLGEDISRDGLKKTPFRVSKALRDATRGYKQNVSDIVEGALFAEAGLDTGVGHAGGAGGLVVVRDLNLFSYCESCLLPFQVKCHVGYVPSGQRVVGLSKLSRVADVFTKRLQEPQRLADEISEALHLSIQPAGVAVVLECQHICFPTSESVFLDSISQGCVKLLVSSGAGVFEDEDGPVWGEFFSLVKYRRLSLDRIQRRDSSDQWCPSRASSKISGNLDPGMVRAVTSILKPLGEDPSRNELVGTPSRFVKWLVNFQCSNLDMKTNGFFVEYPKCIGNKQIQMQIHSELNLAFWSQCEHHLLPFHGVVHVGYLCNEGVGHIEKSLVQSIVQFYGFKLQVQERLTRQIAETLATLLGGDIMVVAEATHTCMISRGIEKCGSSTATIAVLGRFSTDPAARAVFLESLPSTNDF